VSAKQATSFFIQFKYFTRIANNVQSLTNEETNEKMVIEEHRFGRVKISRFPMAATKEWIEEMAKYQHGYRNITIDFRQHINDFESYQKSLHTKFGIN
jgi:hypothetical protein